jgi:5-formyltetrahydrofolate cyclo-ligase
MTPAPDAQGPAPMPTSGSDKAVWRAWARRERARWASGPGRALDEEAMAAHLAAWPPWRAARWALVYLPFGDEPAPLGTALLRTGTPEDGPRLSTTRTASRTSLTLHELAPTALERHAFGFDQPQPGAPVVPPDLIDVVLVPGVCFDRHGTRLGYGRGLYDRLLTRLPQRVQTVGVTPELLVVDALPREAHDVPMRWLLTERGHYPVDE